MYWDLLLAKIAKPYTKANQGMPYMQFKRFCIFCGHNRNKLSKEHIFPDWLGTGNHVEMGVDGFSIRFQEYSYEPVSGKRIVNEFRRPIIRNGDPHKHKLEVVCEECNNEWMSELQNEAKPLLLGLLSGELNTLNQEQRNMLTKWVTMFTMVSEFINRDNIVISQEARSAFKETRAVPKELMVSVAKYTGKKMKGSIPTFLGNSRRTGPMYDYSLEKNDFRGSMFAIGKALFIVTVMPEFLYSNKTVLNFEQLEQLGFNFISGPIKSPIIGLTKEIDDLTLYRISLRYFHEAALAYFPDAEKRVDILPKAYLKSEDRARMTIIHEDEAEVYALSYQLILPPPLEQ